MTELAISVTGLRKSYGALEAVRGIDLRVERGEVFALLGPNGAGKTTAVEILEGHRQRTAGEVSVLGFDPGRGDRNFKRRIGIVLQEVGVDPYLTVEETVGLFAGYYPSPLSVAKALELVELTEQRKTRVSKLSGGQQRRLDVAVGLAGDPELLFLDEPTTGFDPSARRNAWSMVRNLQSLGKTIFLTTHYMEEAEQLADRVAIIARGRIVAEGKPRSLIGGGPEVVVSFTVEGAQTSLPPTLGEAAEVVDGVVRLATDAPTRTLHELTGWALSNSVELRNLQVSRPSLEDAYLQLVGEAEEQSA